MNNQAHRTASGPAHVPEGASPAVTHVGCGAEVRAVVRCAAGHEVDEVDLLVTGPDSSGGSGSGPDQWAGPVVLMPPSTGMTAPVTNVEAREDR